MCAKLIRLTNGVLTLGRAADAQNLPEGLSGCIQQGVVGINLHKGKMTLTCWHVCHVIPV